MREFFIGMATAGIAAVVLFGANISGVGDNDSENPATNSAPITATKICEFPETQFYHVTQESGAKLYSGTYKGPDVRYDLTWRDGTDVAVEELFGANTSVWAERMSPEFLACVSTKNMLEVQESH